VLLPVPIDKSFVPYAKRRVLRRNQNLFVDGGRAGGVAAPTMAMPAGSHFVRMASNFGPPGSTPCHWDVIQRRWVCP
jgi:hypothetical protein